MLFIITSQAATSFFRHSGLQRYVVPEALPCSLYAVQGVRFANSAIRQLSSFVPNENSCCRLPLNAAKFPRSPSWTIVALVRFAKELRSSSLPPQQATHAKKGQLPRALEEHSESAALQRTVALCRTHDSKQRLDRSSTDARGLPETLHRAKFAGHDKMSQQMSTTPLR